MTALVQAEHQPFSSVNHQGIHSPPPTPAARQPPLHPITTARIPTSRGPAKPLTLQKQATPYTHPQATATTTTAGAQPSPLTPLFRAHHKDHFNPQHHQGHHPLSSLPSPPLSSVEPPANSGFFPKSPLQERCEALESELSALRTRLKRAERSSFIQEKRLGLFQQQSTDTQQSLQSVKTQHKSTLAKLQVTQHELGQAKSTLILKDQCVQQLKSINQEQEGQMTEIILEREVLSTEMKISGAENKRLQKRLQTSTEKVEKLQQENRQLIEQLQELRSKATEVSDAQLGTEETLDREKIRNAMELQASKHKAEVDRLQNLVLMMGNRHVQVQTQVEFFQQQAQQLQQQLGRFEAETLGLNRQDHYNSSMSCFPMTSTSASKTGSSAIDDSTLTSLLTSVASVAATPHCRRTRPIRRFTVNASRRDGELTLEQRKCEFLMDQISVLQRGYDSIRQEKVTLELQLDLLQRQHQYHQQQRQKRRDSQRRTLGQEQSAALSNALAIMVSNGPMAASGSSALSVIPSTPLLPTISAAEQEREKARIQYELEQAQIRSHREAEEKEAQKQAAKAAAEEAEREAIRQRRAKSLHLKETLASLEAKHERSDSRTIHFSASDELKHLEQLRLIQDQPQPLTTGSENAKFQNSTAIRASRRMVSPLSLSSNHPSSAISSPSPASVCSPSFTSPSPSMAAREDNSFAASHYTPQHQRQSAYYTHPSHHGHYRQAVRAAYTFDIEQCSCCLGPMIEL
ncbi:hypothetical protein EDD11_006557 [Mortierella claussenii]|nr:hypothetical protein EDD11_006557 [Mortierella claussenii]